MPLLGLGAIWGQYAYSLFALRIGFSFQERLYILNPKKKVQGKIDHVIYYSTSNGRKTSLVPFKAVEKIFFLFYIIVVLIYTIKNCSIQTMEGQTMEGQTDEQIKEYIRDLKYDLKRLVSLPPEREVIPGDLKSTTREGKSLVVCTREHKDFDTTMLGGTVLSPILDVVWPGGLVYLDENLASGVPIPVRIKRPDSLNVYIDLPKLENGGNILIKNPSGVTVFSEINRVVDEWGEKAKKEGLKNKSLSSISTTTSYNSFQLGLSLGFNFKSASASVQSSLSGSTNTENKITVAMFRQVYFSAYFEIKQDFLNVFSKDASLEDIKKKITNEKVPGYVSQVDFGRIILLKMETSSTVTDVEAQGALSYSVSDNEVSASLRMKYEQIIKNSSVTSITIGGDVEANSNILASPSLKKLRSLIEGYKNNVVLSSSQALPISYYSKDLKSSQLAKISASGDFWEIKCKKYTDGWVQFTHHGAYVAYFEANWFDGAGQQQKWESGNKTSGWSYRLEIPGTSTNVKVSGYLYTGLAWDPVHQIFSQSFDAPPNTTWNCYGTTLNDWVTN